MFGSYANDGASNGLPAVFPDDLMGYGMDDGDHGDPKRRRIARVCVDSQVYVSMWTRG
jgi:hypothetical protein